MARTNTCKICFRGPLTKDEIGANKKLLGKDKNEYMCLDCLAGYFDCTRQDIEDKIEGFKEEGCTLFQ